MAKLQGLLFGLATLVLVVVSTFFFTKTWLPALVSDRGRHRPRHVVSLVVTGVVFIATNLLPRLVRLALPGRAGRRAPPTGTTTRARVDLDPGHRRDHARLHRSTP